MRRPRRRRWRGAQRARTVVAGFTTSATSARSGVRRRGVARRDRRGRRPGPRMRCAGAYVTCPGGGGDITGLASDVDAGAPRAAVRRGELRRRGSPTGARDPGRGADFIKIIATGAVLDRGHESRRRRSSPRRRCGAAVEEAALYGTLRRGPRARRRGDQARGPGGGPFDRARLADGRRGDRPHGADGHLPGGRHLQRRLASTR